MVLNLSAAAWLLRNAWRKPRGQLQYAQGQWAWLHADAEIPGTLRLHLDLQNYILVSFVPHQPSAFFSLTTTQWFHLEKRHLDSVAGAHSWLALRRAVVSQGKLPHEERLV